MDLGAEGQGQETETGPWSEKVSLGTAGAGGRRVVKGRAWEPSAGSQP